MELQRPNGVALSVEPTMRHFTKRAISFGIWASRFHWAIKPMPLAAIVELRRSPVQLAGSDLNTLRRERNRSDYDVNRDLNQADALLQVRAAGRILQILDGAGKDPIR